MSELILLVPEAPAPAAEKAVITERKAPTGALRLGLLDNSKANADHLLRLIAEQVRAEVPAVKSVVSQNKTSVAIPMKEEVLQKLMNESDLVISAMAD